MRLNSRIIGRSQYVLPQPPSDEKTRCTLDILVNQEPMSPHVMSSIAQYATTLPTVAHQYPKWDVTKDRLLQRISSGLGDVDNKMSAANIILTNGSDNALKLLLEAFAHSEEILIVTPTYPHFVSFAENMHTQIHYFDCLQLEKEEWMNSSILLTAVSREIDSILQRTGQRCNLCYLCSPNLPLGYTLTASDVESLIKSQSDTMFIIDEAYYGYSNVESASSLIGQYQNIVVTRTFSKLYGLAGLRIGYLLASKENIKNLSVLVNEKNVTSLAMTAALAALEDNEYYRDQLYQFNELKDSVDRKLQQLCRSDAPIFDYNLESGNFFLVFAQDTEYVCQLFKRHGIYIRDKSKEIPHAIRILLGTKKQMEQVLLLIFYINLSTLVRKLSIVFDLDNTLRRGSKGTDYINMEISDDRDDIYICTNNCIQTPKEISLELMKHANINISEERIISPLTKFWDMAVDGHLRPFVIGTASAKEYLNAVDASDANCILICGIYFDNDAIDVVADLHQRRKLPVYYTDKAEYTTSDCCSESNLDNERILLPDMQSYIKMLDIDAIYIGKPNLRISQNSIMIGDSIDTDGQTASKSGAWFIHVVADSDEKAELTCDLDNGIVTIPRSKLLHLFGK